MLEGLEPPLAESLCKVSRQAAELSKEDFEILQAALDDPRWSASALSNALSARGFAIGDGAIRKHRAKNCCCVR